MTQTGFDRFDQTTQKSTRWLDEIAEEMGGSREDAYQALRASLTAVRDRLPTDEAVHFSAGLPGLLRGVYFEGYHPAATPMRERSHDEFVSDVDQRLQGAGRPDIDAEQALKCVFSVAATELDAGQVEKVIQGFPVEMRGLFPQSMVEAVESRQQH